MDDTSTGDRKEASSRGPQEEPVTAWRTLLEPSRSGTCVSHVCALHLPRVWEPPVVGFQACPLAPCPTPSLSASLKHTEVDARTNREHGNEQAFVFPKNVLIILTL